MKLLLSKIWGWAFKSSLYLEKLKSDGEFVIYLIIHMAAILVSDFWWSLGVFHYLFEVLTDENVGIDTTTKSLDCLIGRYSRLSDFT